MSATAPLALGALDFGTLTHFPHPLRLIVVSSLRRSSASGDDPADADRRSADDAPVRDLVGVRPDPDEAERCSFDLRGIDEDRLMSPLPPRAPADAVCLRGMDDMPSPPVFPATDPACFAPRFFREGNVEPGLLDPDLLIPLPGLGRAMRLALVALVVLNMLLPPPPGAGAAGTTGLFFLGMPPGLVATLIKGAAALCGASWDPDLDICRESSPRDPDVLIGLWTAAAGLDGFAATAGAASELKLSVLMGCMLMGVPQKHDPRGLFGQSFQRWVLWYLHAVSCPLAAGFCCWALCRHRCCCALCWAFCRGAICCCCCCC